MTASTFAVVINPHTRLGPCGPLCAEALARLRDHGRVQLLETAGDGADGARIAALIAAAAPRAVIAAGGDGTVREVAEVLCRAHAAPPLAILPLGTANNVARSLGQWSVRRLGTAAVERAVAAAVGGRMVALDLGEVDGRCFVGSFAVGMDAAILAARNRWRARLRLGRRLGGYPLYLLSCAVNLARQRAVTAQLRCDGEQRVVADYNLLVTNTALYAGEFRFDADEHSDDGCLDLHVFESAAEYVRGFVAAWRRHVHWQRGQAVAAPMGLRRIERVEIELARPLPSQLDGEESGCRDRFSVRVVPAALQVLLPG